MYLQFSVWLPVICQFVVYIVHLFLCVSVFVCMSVYMSMYMCNSCQIHFHNLSCREQHCLGDFCLCLCVCICLPIAVFVSTKVTYSITSAYGNGNLLSYTIQCMRFD